MDVSFSERLSNIVALSNALASSSLGQGTDVRAEARRLEGEIFAEATSNEEYERLCDGVILAQSGRDHPSQQSETEDDDDDDEIFNPDGPEIGDYIHSTFYRDGQMSTVFKARSKNPDALEKVVALKVTTPASMSAPHNSIREARILLAAVHSHIVPLLESFHQRGGRFVLVFPFLRQDLENLLRSGVLTPHQSSLVFHALFSALAHIHSLGLVHRDIKPSNILLRSMSGPVYLADFGIAWSPQDPDSEPPTSKITDVGTTSYRAPELLFGCHNYTTSLDIWAAGCLVAELLHPSHTPLFDAGPLGSELGLIKSMFTTLGTPTDETWPSAKTYPDWNKMRFQTFPAKPWSSILPGASQPAIEFVSSTVSFESTRRLTAAEALQRAASLGW